MSRLDLSCIFAMYGRGCSRIVLWFLLWLSGRSVKVLQVIVPDFVRIDEKAKSLRKSANCRQFSSNIDRKGL